MISGLGAGLEEFNKTPAGPHHRTELASRTAQLRG
jgi:hypothetical protein